jgi:hypothetical protein
MARGQCADHISEALASCASYSVLLLFLFFLFHTCLGQSAVSAVLAYKIAPIPHNHDWQHKQVKCMHSLEVAEQVVHAVLNGRATQAPPVPRMQAPSSMSSQRSGILNALSFI